MAEQRIKLSLFIHMRDPKNAPKSIRVSKDGVYRETDENPYLPVSQIEIVHEPVGLGPAIIEMPVWLAKKKGLMP